MSAQPQVRGARRAAVLAVAQQDAAPAEPASPMARPARRKVKKPVSAPARSSGALLACPCCAPGPDGRPRPAVRLADLLARGRR